MNCKKCNKELITEDFWTLKGDYLRKPTVCKACKRKNGQHAKAEQDKQIIQSETRKHAKHMENVLNNLLR